MSMAGLSPPRSRDEIEAAVRGFSASDWVRLRKIAKFYANVGAIEADDLIQEAMMRALSTRTCPSHVDVVRFLAETMRSIAHGEREKMRPVAQFVPVSRTGDSVDQGTELVDEGDAAEAVLILKQDAAHCVATYGAIRTLFEDDPIAKDVLEGLLEDLTPAEIQELTGLDATGYDSKRRLIRRRIEKAYPKGWKL